VADPFEKGEEINPFPSGVLPMRTSLFVACCFAAFALPSAAFAEDPHAAERQVTVSGANGGGFTATGSGSRDREAGTWQRNRDTLFNNGSTRSVTVDGQTTGPGAADVTRTVTGRNGETRTQTGAVQTTRTETGRITTGDWQGENGAFSTSREVVRQENGRTIHQSVVSENGRTRSSDTAFTRTAPGEGTFNRTVTGPGGNTRNQEGTVTRTRRGS
jgi:hypothetical protein